MTLIEFLLLLTVFLTPLLGASFNFGYEQIKVLFFIVSISLSGFLWLMRRPIFRWTGISIVAGLFIITLFVTSIIGIEPQTSFFGSEPYFQGVILYAYLFLFFLLVSASKIKFVTWAYVLVGSSTIVGLLAIGDWIQINLLGHQLPTYAGRVVSTFGQPNFYAGFLLLTLPFFNFLLKQKQKGFWILLGFLIVILAIILSESRVAFMLLSLLLLLWLILELPFKKLIFGVISMILFITFALSVNFGAGWVEKELTSLRSNINPDLTTIGVEKRYYIWPILGKLILEHPVTGYGLENIAPVFSEYFEINKHTLFEENLKVKPYLFGLKDLNLDRAHNYLLDLLLFSGIFGVVCWAIIVFLLIKKLLLSKVTLENNVLWVGLITYLVWIQFQNQSVVHLIYFWLLVGLVDQD